MIPPFHNQEEHGSRVIDLADGRVLFLPRGRGGPAYVVEDYLAGGRVEERLQWAERIAQYAGSAVFLAASFMERWLWFGWLVPLLLLPRVVESVLVATLQPATDSIARAEAEALDPGAVSWGGVAAFLATAAWWWFLWTSGDRNSGQRRLELTLVGLAVLGSGVALFRQHRTAQERRITAITRDPENIPTTPR